MRSRARYAAGLGAAALAAAVAVAVVAAPGAGASTPSAAGQARPAAVAAVRTALGKPAGKPSKNEADPVVKAAAKRFGLSEKKIDRALMAVKKYVVSKQGPSTKDRTSKGVDLLSPAVVRVFAKSLGVSTSRARAVLTFLQAGWKNAGRDSKPGKPPAEESAAAVKFLVGELHISKAQAEKVWATLQKMSGTSEQDPAFAALARSLHVTPERLTEVLVNLKKFLGSLQPKPGEPKPGEPKPGEPKPPAPVKP